METMGENLRRLAGLNKMPEQIKYPTEAKMETARRVIYNAEVTKLINGERLSKISVTDLTNETLRKLLNDITGLNTD